MEYPVLFKSLTLALSRCCGTHQLLNTLFEIYLSTSGRKMKKEYDIGLSLVPQVNHTSFSDSV